MDAKVNEQWFEKNGWQKWVDEDRKPTTHIIYSLHNEKAHARFDHHYEVTRDRCGIHKSNWYMFSCSGRGFHIENRISFRRFSIEQIESALKIVGLI